MYEKRAFLHIIDSIFPFLSNENAVVAFVALKGLKRRSGDFLDRFAQSLTEFGYFATPVVKPRVAEKSIGTVFSRHR